jgi:Xaa-Pro dipeptidase
MIKDAEEIALMRQASLLNDQAMESLIGQMKEGVTEKELASFLTEAYLALGADFPIGLQCLCFGANAADPHHTPDNTALSAGHGALFDIFTPIARYWCDMTRTVYFRSVSREEEMLYKTVRQAVEAATAVIRPGVPLADIDAAAREIISEAGFGTYFPHRLGHGAGLECHEPPDCAPASRDTAAPGMVFSVEPGIYIPGQYGVRIEDLVLVTETGCEPLNKVPKTLRVIAG